jgi:peptidoglycan/LPS O-acetylase OafA/YrhL
MSQGSAAEHLTYRPDIDGLRAFAVMSVVVFHAFPSLLPGGFVGVDIFFVISGFLISSIMFTALNDQRFSFIDFYARRVNRIFPALIVVLLTTFGFAWFILFNDELDQLGKHLLRAAAFLSNFILWHESGYFDNAAETKPLLHLWSLAIEEQFYIVWPLMVWVLWRWKVWRWYVIGFLAVASLSWNVYQSQHDLTHDFYSPLTRFWELLSGALLAYWMFAQRPSNHNASAAWVRTANLRASIGAVLLLYAVFVIDGSRQFPGGWALLPVIGAVLLISGGQQGWINRAVFARTSMVWLGTISYPLYLWHWPVFSFARIVVGETPPVWMRSISLLTSILLAWLTYRFIERPIRFGWRLRYKSWVLVCAMLCVGVLGYLTHKADGYPQRAIMENLQVFHEGDIGHDTFHEYHRLHFFTCADPILQKDAGRWKDLVRCFQSHQEGPVTLLLLGDSHAEHLFLGIAQQLPKVNVGFYGKGALPLLSKDEFRSIFDHVLNNGDIRQVVISTMWASHKDELIQGKTLSGELGLVVQALQASGKKVYLTDDLPQFEFDPQRCQFKRPLTQSTKCEAPMSAYQAQRKQYMSELNEVLARHADVGWIDLSSLMCKEATCSMAPNGQLLYRDNNHLNILGSKYVGAQIMRMHPELGGVAR